VAPRQRAPLSIAHVTPFAWETAGEVNTFVARIADELADRSHRVLIVAPSQDTGLVRASRRALREQGERLLERVDRPLVLGVGEVLPFAPTRRRSGSLPVDVARTIEHALGDLALDIVHVHEPFAPSASSAALRHSHALNVGSFHAPTERILSTQLARPLSRLLFGRLDARTASYRATAELMRSFFPGDYRVIRPGAELPEEAQRKGSAVASDSADGQVRLLLVLDEERGALRTFLRALRTIPAQLDWTATVWSPKALAAPATLNRRLRERIEFRDSHDFTREEALRRADVLVLGSEGIAPAPGTLLAGLAEGLVPVASRLDVYAELLDEGEYGLLFEPGDAETLGGQLARVISQADLRERLRASAAPLRESRSWARTTDELEELYLQLVARRHDQRTNARLRKRLSSRRLIDVDLHMHTDHSYDCATPVEVLLSEARRRGLGAIAVTDHNEISGALEARAKATDGVKVIVAEEIKTASQGEVIGLFIEEKIPRGLTLEATIAEIKKQGGIVYVPHPFDRLHSVPDYEHLMDVLHDVDAIEVFNPRVAISEFNDEAVRFAAKYRIPAGAGSDAHVPQGLGSVRIRMRDFDGPEEFLESLRDADIVRNPASLLYVQALKFLQTKAMPAPARRASRERRVRRVARKS
jgi:glycosyltransferase involved in cell wall biosynthesis